MINHEAKEELVEMAKLCQLAVRESGEDGMMPVFVAFDGMLSGWIYDTHQLLDQVGDGAISEKIIIAEYIEFIWSKLGVGGIESTAVALSGRMGNFIDLHGLRSRLRSACTINE